MSSVQQAQPPVLNLQFNATHKPLKMADEKQSANSSSRLVPKRMMNLKSEVETVPEENDFGDDESCATQDEDEERLEMKEIKSTDPNPHPVFEHKRLTDNLQIDSKNSSPAGSLRRLPIRTRQFLDTNNIAYPSTSTNNASAPSSMLVSSISSPNFRRDPSMRSLKNYHHLMSDIHGVQGNKPPSSVDSGYGMSGKPFSDGGSVRSWASVGMGSTDGKKMIVRRVPTSPVELFNIVNPPTKGQSQDKNGSNSPDNSK